MAITIGKAIEALRTASSHEYTYHNKDFDNAIELGIEALKRINNPLQYNLINPRILLPGEAES